MRRMSKPWLVRSVGIGLLFSGGMAHAQGGKYDPPATSTPAPAYTPAPSANRTQSIQYTGPLGGVAAPSSGENAVAPGNVVAQPETPYYAPPVIPAPPPPGEPAPNYTQREPTDRYRTGNPIYDAEADRLADDPNTPPPSGSGALVPTYTGEGTEQNFTPDSGGEPNFTPIDGDTSGAPAPVPAPAPSPAPNQRVEPVQSAQQTQGSGYLTNPDGTARPTPSNPQTLHVDIRNPYAGLQDINPEYLHSQYFDRRALQSQSRLASAADNRDFGALGIGTIAIAVGSVSMPLSLAAIGAKQTDRGAMARTGQALNISAGWMLFASAQLVRSAERLQRISHEPNAMVRHQLLQELKVRDGRMTRSWGTATTAIGGLLLVGGLVLDASRESRGVCGPFDVCSDDVHLGAMAKAGVSTLAVGVPALVTGILMERFATRRLNAMTPDIMMLPVVSTEGAGATLMINW